MIHPSRQTLHQEIEQQTRLVRGLMAALYALCDTEPDKSLLRELAEAKKAFRELQRRRDAELAEAEKGQAGPLADQEEHYGGVLYNGRRLGQICGPCGENSRHHEIRTMLLDMITISSPSRHSHSRSGPSGGTSRPAGWQGGFSPRRE